MAPDPISLKLVADPEELARARAAAWAAIKSRVAFTSEELDAIEFAQLLHELLDGDDVLFTFSVLGELRRIAAKLIADVARHEPDVTPLQLADHVHALDEREQGPDTPAPG